MSELSRIFSRAWLLVPAAACFFLLWIDHGRIQRVEYVSSLAGPAPAIVVASPTGYAGGQREMIVPERNETSFGWLAQTQQMLAQGDWRVRHVDYDNAPAGREVSQTSPYRWWLGLVAWFDHVVTGRTPGLAIERAALYADPLLHVLGLVGLSALVAWRFGWLAGTLMAVGAATVFPFAASFLPGEPDHHGLARLLATGSILLLLAGLRAGAGTGRWFALAGVVGGLGLWVDVPTLVPVLAGIIPGGLIAAWISRPNSTAGAIPPVAAPWRLWAVGGATTVFAAYLLEYFPAHLGGWNLEVIHPIYGIAWLGAGELLTRAAAWIRGEKRGWNFSDVAAMLAAAVAVAALPVVMAWSNGRTFLVRDLLSVRLTGLPNGAVAADLRAWLARDGLDATVLATLLPLLILVPAVWRLLRRSTDTISRATLAVALGPVAVALGFAWWQLGWWSVLDGVLLVLAVAMVSGPSPAKGRTGPWLTAVLALGIAGSGLARVWPATVAGPALTLTAREAEVLIERHLAHWLVRRSGGEGMVVYAPPLETTTLAYYGGLRGIGTFSSDNRAGFGVSLMIAGANTIEEAQAMLQARGARYIVVLSWDRFFDEFMSLYLDKKFAQRPNFFVGELRRWRLPAWLRPVPYQMPEIGGFENQSVLVFEVVDDQSPVVAASRLAEYFVETGRLDDAATAADALRRFPGDVGALAAQAQVQNARGDAAGAAQTLAALRERLAAGGDRYLPWDRRVSLAIVLAQGGDDERAREQVRRCVADVNEPRLRSLTTGLLFNLQVLTRGFALPIADPKLNQLALDLLPPEMRSHL